MFIRAINAGGHNDPYWSANEEGEGQGGGGREEGKRYIDHYFPAEICMKPEI